MVNEINLLLKFERNREILMQYKVDSFSKEEIALMEKDFDDIGTCQSWKWIYTIYLLEKNNKYVKYKKEMLFYIYDFTIPYDNNFMERALKMIKSKTKISGGFRSDNRGLRFGNIMSIIKTSKLRNINLIS